MDLSIVVRVRRNNYMHGNKLVSNVTATLLKRMSNGSLSDLIQDTDVDIDQMDLSSCDDGVYSIDIINPSYDCETGFCDDYELCLTKIKGGG